MSSKHKDKHLKAATNDLLGEVEHTPIIITDGSASIQFHLPLYPFDPVTGFHKSSILLLRGIDAHKAHPGPNGKTSCHDLLDGEECVIVVTCKVNGKGDEQFLIRGGNSALPAMSPSIKFSHDEFKEGPDFPPETFPGKKQGNRFGNKDRRPTKLEIFTVAANGSLISVHDCPLISDPQCKYVINDDHATEE